jgi:hypothetical protein
MIQLDLSIIKNPIGKATQDLHLEIHFWLIWEDPICKMRENTRISMV